MSKPVSGINPQLLVWAREKSGQTVADVAAAIKKDPDVVSSWERGDSSPTYVQLETLAYRIYKRPVALFFFPEPPPEPDPKQAFQTLPDTEIDELEADTRFKVREAVAMQLSLAELAQGQNPASRQILRDITVSSPMSAEAAVEARKGEGGNYYNTQAVYLSERYAHLAFSSYYRGAISLEKLADHLNVKVKSVPGLEQAILQRAARQAG